MTLVITAAAALIVTVLRFAKPAFARRFGLGLLALILWGASLMWLVDFIAVTVAGQAFIDFADRTSTLDDVLLGVSVLGLALIVWGVVTVLKGRQARAA